MTEYLEPEDLDDLIARKGFSYRDRNLMLAAVGAPLPVFGEEVYPGIHAKAAVLMLAVNRNHPLLDGNKRLSWYVTVAFYYLNGYLLEATPDDADRYIRLVASENPPTLEDVMLWLDKHARPMADADRS